MGYVVIEEGEGVVFRLAGHLDDQDFDTIEMSFESVIEQPAARVVFDFGEVERVSSSLVALVGLLRLHACRSGGRVELRNLDMEAVAAALVHS